jgi:quercetin dioxygenase-like cupin family protein
MRLFILGFAFVGVFLGLCETTSAQRTGICQPVSERARIGDVGCWIIAHGFMGELTQPQIFWHLDTYPTRSAAEAAKGPRGTVVESFGKAWLLTIEDKGWRASSGERIAEIGPLPVTAGGKYSAPYMEATFDPGMTAPSHDHPGPEAWHTLAGETCLETPDEKFIGRAGGPPVIIPAGPPMHLTATGTEQRHALVLILHDAARDPSIPRRDWVPKGLCKN